MTRNAPDPVGVGLIGCGRIAASHLDGIARTPECRLVGVADSDAAAARAAGEQRGAPAHTDYKQLAETPGLEAVIVATPPGTHAEIAGWFLGRGVHVLCEKPLARSLPEATALLKLADAGDRLLMMASKFRYVDDVLKARGILDSGILGDVILFENVFCSKVDMSKRWNAARDVSGGGVLIDNGTHSVDIARYLLGPIVKVRAEEGRRVQNLEVEDTCRLFFGTETGAMGAIDLSWSIHKERDAYLEVFGVNGALSVGWKGSKYRQSEQLKWIEFGRGYDKNAAFAAQLRNFALTIRGCEAPRITGEDALESVRVIDAAYRSIASGQWIPVATPPVTVA